MERPRALSISETTSSSSASKHIRRQFKLKKLKYRDSPVPLADLINKPPTDTVIYSSKVEERPKANTGANFEFKPVYGNEDELEIPDTLEPGTVVIISPILKKDDFVPVDLCLPFDGRLIKVQVYRKLDHAHNIQVNIVPTHSIDPEDEEVQEEEGEQEPPVEVRQSRKAPIQLQEVNSTAPVTYSPVPVTYSPAIQNHHINSNGVYLSSPPKVHLQEQLEPAVSVVHRLNLQAILPPTVQTLTGPTPCTQLPVSQQLQFKSGFSVKCDYCGILSPTLLKCVRCQKVIKSRVLIPDPNGAKMYPIKQSQINGSVEPMGHKVRLLGNLPFEDKTSQDETQSNGFKGLSSNIPPEDVINEIESQYESGSSQKYNFTKVFSSLIRIGSYRVNPKQDQLFEVLFSTVGVLFKIPHCVSGELQKCVIPSHSIAKVVGNLHAKSNLALVFFIGPKLAIWIRNLLGMGEKSTSRNYLCPIAGAGIQTNIAFRLEDSLDTVTRACILKLYKEKLDEKLDVNKLLEFTTNGVKSKVETKQSERLAVASNKAVTPRTRSQVQDLLVNNTSEAHELYTRIFTTGSVIIHDRDVLCLENEQFLNDTIIDYWLKLVVDSLDETLRNRIHLFSTFFYGRLTTRQRKKSCAPWEFDSSKSQAEKRHCRVQKWTKKVDIFDKDFLIIPVNESFHWFLVIICFPGLDGPHTGTGEPAPWFKNRTTRKRNSHAPPPDDLPPEPDRDEEPSDTEENVEDEPDSQLVKTEPSDSFYTPEQQRIISTEGIHQPCILMFDSLAAEPRQRIYSTLREYLKIEYKVRKGADNETLSRRFNKEVIPGHQPTIPQQPNTCDCGVYVLEYVEQFFKKPIKSFAIPLPNLVEWFPDTIVYTKRKEIYDHIAQTVAAKYPDKSRFLPELHFELDDMKMEVDDDEYDLHLEEGTSQNQHDSSSTENFTQPSKRKKIC